MKDDENKLGSNIRDLAESLLDDLVTGEIIRRVGAHVNFTPEEEGIVNRFAEKADFLKAFKPPNYNGPGFHENTIVAIGVARRVAEGEFTSFNDPKAKHLIEENMLPTFEVEPGNWGAVYDRLRGREIEFDDFYRIFVEYMELPEFPTLMEEWRRAHCEEDSAYQQWGDAVAPAIKIMRRYGLVRGIDFAGIADAILVNDIDYTDPNAVLKVVKQYNKLARVREMDND